MTNKLKIFDVKWTSLTAGPSPDDNRRTEIFLWGCNMAASGAPCKNCFNPELWNVSDAVRDYSPREVADNINKHAPNKFVTIVGGEPLDQIIPLAELCQYLKEYGFHIILFTHYRLREIMIDANLARDSDSYLTLLHNIDMLIDGKYDETQRIYDESTGDGLHDAVGSGNQIIWDFEDWRVKSNNGMRNYPIQGMRADSLCGIFVCDNGELRYITKDDGPQWESTEMFAS